jgi:hypothetical protein
MIPANIKHSIVGLKQTISICNSILDHFVSQINLPGLEDINGWKEICNDLGIIIAIKLMKLKTDFTLVQCKNKVDEIMKK